MHLSVSQIKTFSSDPLGWIMHYIEGIKLPPTEALYFGKDFATAIECCINRQTMEEGLSPVAVGLAEKWYKRNQMDMEMYPWESEHKFRIALAEGLPEFIGAIDICCVKDNILHLYDYKTASFSWDRKTFWGLETKTDLRKDYQLSLYVHSMLQEHPEIETIMIGHHQIIKVKEKGQIIDYFFRTVKTDTTEKKVKNVLTKIIKCAKMIVEVRELYNKDGFDGILKYYGVNRLTELTENYQYGRPNPFWNFYIGRETLEDLKKRIN